MTGPHTGKRGKTLAHSASQLRELLDLSSARFEAGTAAGVIPGPDLASGRWSGAAIDAIWARADHIRAEVPDVLSERELKDALGIYCVEGDYGYFLRGREHGIIPAPDHAGRFWSRAVADELVGHADQIRQDIGPNPLGAGRCADRLAHATGMAVAAEDVLALAAAGYTSVVGEWEGFPLYDVKSLDRVPSDPQALEHLTGLVAARAERIAAWKAASVTAQEAAVLLGWKWRDFEQVAQDRGLTPGPLLRYARTDVAALAEDDALMEQVRGATLLGTYEAADLMDLRRTDFAHVVAAGWVSPRGWADVWITDKLQVSAPLYRISDLEAVLAMPIDWDAVRSVPPGGRSALLEYVGLPRTRA